MCACACACVCVCVFLTCSSAAGRPHLLLRLAGERLPVQMCCLCGMCGIPLAPISSFSSTSDAGQAPALPEPLWPGGVGGGVGGPTGASVPAPAGPPLGGVALLGRRGQRAPGGGAVVGQLSRFFVLRDGVVPDLTLVICIVLFSRVRAAGLWWGAGRAPARLREGITDINGAINTC